MDDQRQLHITRREFLRYAALSSTGLAAAGILGACATPPTAVPPTSAAVAPTTVPPTAAPPASAPTSTAAPTAAPIQKVKVQLNWIENSQWGPLLAAEKEGYAKEVGLEQEFLPGGPQVDPIQAVAGGTAPFGIIGGLNQLVLARAGGIPVKGFGAMWQNLPFGVISLAAKPIKTPKDAIGKKIGLQSGARSTWSLILAANNMTEDQMTIVPVGVDPTPLVSGQVDGYWGTATGQLIALKSQGVQVEMMYMADAGAPGYGSVVFALEKTLQEQEDLLVRWLKAAIKGGQYYLTHADDIGDYTVKRAPSLNLKVDDEKAQARALVDFVQSPLTKSKALFWMDPAVATTLVDVMLRAGQIKAKIDAKDLLTTTVLEKATGLK